MFVRVARSPAVSVSESMALRVDDENHEHKDNHGKLRQTNTGKHGHLFESNATPARQTQSAPLVDVRSSSIAASVQVAWVGDGAQFFRAALVQALCRVLDMFSA